MNSVCEGNPCPEGTECLGDPKEGKYSCVCQDSKAGQCPGKKFTLKISVYNDITFQISIRFECCDNTFYAFLYF